MERVCSNNAEKIRSSVLKHVYIISYLGEVKKSFLGNESVENQPVVGWLGG